MENHAVALEVGVGGVQGEVGHGVVASFVHCIGASFVEGCLRISSVLIRMSSGGRGGRHTGVRMSLTVWPVMVMSAMVSIFSDVFWCDS